MKGSINFLKHLKSVCEESKGNCDNCPLKGKEQKKNFCPFLSKPFSWDDDTVIEMVRDRCGSL